MLHTLAALLLASTLLAGISQPAFAKPAAAQGIAAGRQIEWGKVLAPSPGPLNVVGSYTNGCIGGARSLPPEGPGHQVVRMSRSRYFGHPETIDFLLNLGRQISEAGLGVAPIGDISQPRGGPMPFGHASHQVGLDADIWFRLDLPPLPRTAREDLDLFNMVDPATHRVDPAHFTDAQAEMLRLAATDPRVGRIFVNPAIKLALCERDWADRSWLRLIRPWYGHDAHFHVRLNCPADQAGCTPQDPPPPGDGCGEEVMSWLNKPPPVIAIGPPKEPKQRPPMPVACGPILQSPP